MRYESGRERCAISGESVNLSESMKATIYHVGCDIRLRSGVSALQTIHYYACAQTHRFVRYPFSGLDAESVVFKYLEDEVRCFLYCLMQYAEEHVAPG